MAEETNTEEQVLGYIPGIGDDPNEATETQDTEVQAETTDATPEPVPAPANEQAISQGSPDQQERGPSRGPQDLVDKDGNVIAKGGPDRRHYENWQKAQQENGALTQNLQALESQVEAYKNASNLGTQYSLSPEEMTAGAQIMQAWKDDPANTVKYLLTQAQSLGYNVDGIGGTTDVNAIKTMIDQALSPIMQERQDKADTQRIEDEARNQYSSFLQTYPDAESHETALAQLLESDRNLSLEAAYYKLRSFYSEKGLDWSKPLEVLQAEMQQQAVQERGNTQQPLPTGNVSSTTMTGATDIADATTSFDDIIRQSMSEAGMKIN